MKGIKKLIISLLALVMVMGASMTAFAAAGTITITNAKEGQIYNAYRVFDYVPADEDEDNAGNGGIYKLASKFSGLETYEFTDNGKTVKMSSFFTVGDNDILDTSGLATENDVKVFAKGVLAYVKASNGTITNDGTTTAAADASEDNAVTISVSNFGYYIVDSSLGSAVGVDTATPNVTIKEKNSVPELNKEITGATNPATIYDVTGNGAQIGDTVTFTITAVLKVGGKDYAIVDTLTPGLTLVDVQESNISFSNGDLGYTIDNAYVDEKGNKGFKITFEGEPAADTTATVEYQAVVNKDAVIADAANVNEAFLIYGNGTETTHIKTETKTYPIQIQKFANGDAAKKVLPGAEFEVYRASDKTQVKFVKISDTEYKVAPNGTENTVDKIVTVTEKLVTVEGLNAEDYVLVETKAPQGYNLLETSVELDENTKYQHAQKVTVSNKSKVGAIQVVEVEDRTGLTLPSTGGIGTTIFYIVGGILIVAGVAYFIVRRKTAAK